MRSRAHVGLFLAFCTSAAAFAVSAPAAATPVHVLYAAPGGAGDACTTVDPCGIDHAFADAVTGNTISLAGGTYTDAGNVPFSSAIALQPTATGVNIVDRGTKVPVVESNAGAGILLTADSSLTGLVEEYTGSKAGIDVPQGATANRVAVFQTTAGTACAVEGTLTNSLCVNSDGGNAVGFGGFTSVIAPVLDGVTAYASGTGSNGISYESGTAGVATVTVTNTISHGAHLDVQAATADANASTSITLDHSDYATAVALADPGTAKISTGSGNVSTPAQFVDAAKDNFIERSTSPTVDAGATDPTGDTDLAGLSRLIGNGPDIGAYERTVAPKLSTLTTITAGKKALTVKLHANPEGIVGTVLFKATILNPPKGSKGKKTIVSKPEALAAAVAQVPVTIKLAGLTAKTKYSVVVVARNAAGSTTSKPIKVTTK